MAIKNLILDEHLEIEIIKIEDIEISTETTPEGEALFPCSIEWTIPPLKDVMTRSDSITILDVLKSGITTGTYTKVGDATFRKKK